VKRGAGDPVQRGAQRWSSSTGLVQACVCGCGTGGVLWNGLLELERGARGAGTRRHTYVEVSARLSAMVQEW
jgi:hypothetical protein